MAREKPLDATVVLAWQAAWNESDVFSDAAVLHLQSFIPDPLCLVVITLGVGRPPHSLVFRRIKRVVPVATEVTARSALERVPASGIGPLPSMFVSASAPVGPSVGQLWHQTGVTSARPRKPERVLRWDGEDWVIAGYVSDSPTIVKQGRHVCDFQEALASAHEHAKWFECEFIYTYDGSTWGKRVAVNASPQTGAKLEIASQAELCHERPAAQLVSQSQVPIGAFGFEP
jgi:hypothetical protein